MKYCKKCNKSFSDDDVYCTECGEKLSNGYTCPRCGAHVDLDDKFCSKCGYDLKQGNKCPKCGHELKPGSRFCPACGEQLKANQIIDGKKKLSSDNQKGGIPNIAKYILIGVFFLAALISLAGFFGDVFVAKVAGAKSSVTISYFFGDELDTLRSLRDYGDTEQFLFELLSFGVHALTYFGGMIGLLTTIGFGIYFVVRSFKTKTDFPKKTFFFMLLSTLPYVSITAWMVVNSTSLSIRTTLGWGTTLLAVGSLLSAAAYAAYLIMEGERTCKKIAIRSLFSASFLILVLISIFGVSKQVLVRGGGLRANLGIYTFFSSALSSYQSLGHNYNINTYSSSYFVSFFLSVFTVVTIIYSIFTLTSVKKPRMIGGIMFISSIFVASLLSSLLTVIPVAKSYKTVSEITVGLGSGTVFAMLSSVLALGCMITALSLDKE